MYWDGPAWLKDDVASGPRYELTGMRAMLEDDCETTIESLNGAGICAAENGTFSNGLLFSWFIGTVIFLRVYSLDIRVLCLDC